MNRKPTQEPVLVDLNAIATLLRISPRTARRLIREPGFPPPVRLRGCIRWWKCDVLDHVRNITGSGDPISGQN